MTIQNDAQTALDVSDKTVIRCVDQGVQLPETWVTYRQTLRAIVAGTNEGPLPAMPAYPQNT